MASIIYMNSTDKDERDLDIEKLSEILSKIQNIYYKKQEQLEGLKQQISEMKDIINGINFLISKQSFHSADELYLQKVKELETTPEKYFKDKPSEDIVKGTTLKRKIFANDEEREGELLCILEFNDLSQLEINFINPDITAIRETSESFINIFLKGALIKIKDEKPDMGLEYEYYKDLIDLEDNELHLELDKCFALEKKELRKLGIKREKITKKFEKVCKVKGFF